MTTSNDKQPQVLVCQRGARHRYAIPRMLEEAGMLAGLYTDSSVFSPLGRLSKRLESVGVAAARLKALSSRNPSGIPSDKVFSSDRPLFASLSGGLLSPDLVQSFIRRGARGADVVYSMYGEDLGFLKWAKGRGLKIVVDVFVHPRTNHIVAEETARVLGEAGSSAAGIEREDVHSRETFELADLLLCPSQWVADGVREFAPRCGRKIRVAPYGSSIHARPAINESPAAGRILYAGREPLRKGLHYLAEAAMIARQSGVGLDVRVAGVSRSEIEWLEHRDQLNCLGTLPMQEMHREFETADLFVLPSLSEGQAGVVLEAMACGCPVAATRESGVDFEPGCGITVPARNAEILAREIVGVVGHRDRRNQLARGALRQAEVFSMEAWKSRLVSAMQEVVGF